MVSVLLPARDAAATIGLAVRSILEQSLEDFELIAVDDGSTDQTLTVLARIAAGDPRVRVLQSGGAGLVASLNLGLAHCRASLIARMDADDESMPERLARSVEALEGDPALAGVGTQVEIFREDRPVSPNMQAYGRWLNSLTSFERLYADRFIESPLCHPSVTLRRQVLLEVGGFAENGFAEDYQLWLELLKRGHRLRALESVLHRWRDGEHRLTRRDVRYSPLRMLELKARYLVASLPSAVPLTLWGAGQGGLALVRCLEASGARVGRLVDVSPRKIGQRIEGRPVIGPAELGPPQGDHLIAAVGAKGARQEIRRFLTDTGWVEGFDFTCAG